MVKMPGFLGSPSSTATFVPFGSEGGPSTQTTASCAVILALRNAAMMKVINVEAPRSIFVQQKLLPGFCEIVQRLFPFADPGVDVASVLDDLTEARAAGE